MTSNSPHHLLAQVLYRALADDPFYQVLEAAADGEPANQKNALVEYLEYSISEAIEYGLCWIPSENLYGVSVWSLPLNADRETEKQIKKHQFIQQAMGEKSLRIYQQACQFMSEVAKPIIPQQSWYLSIIGVNPELQGRGLGLNLVRDYLHLCDQQQLGCYLETFTPRNQTFYQRLGFQIVNEQVEPTIKARYWLMYRPSKAS